MAVVHSLGSPESHTLQAKSAEIEAALSTSAAAAIKLCHPVVSRLRESVACMLRVAQAAVALGSPHLEARHWKRVAMLLGVGSVCWRPRTRARAAGSGEPWQEGDDEDADGAGLAVPVGRLSPDMASAATPPPAKDVMDVVLSRTSVRRVLVLGLHQHAHQLTDVSGCPGVARVVD